MHTTINPSKENDSRSCPSAVSSRVHTDIQMTAHFPASIWNTKTTVNPLAARSSAKKKIYSLPKASSVFLPPLPELYLPHIILNCLLFEIYSVKPSDSPRRTHLGDFMWGYWERGSCRPNNDKWQRDRFSSLCASPSIVPLSGAAIMSLMAQSPSTLRGKHAEA